jgi:hypothetical protein
MNDKTLLELRNAAFYSAVSSVNYNSKNRKAVADYIRAMRKAGKEYRPALFHDMATIKHGFGMLKTQYRKLMNRAHPGGYWV